MTAATAKSTLLVRRSIPSEETELVARSSRRPKQAGVEPRAVAVEAQTPAGDFEAAAQELGVRSGSLHARAEPGIVQAALARGAHQREHAGRLEGIVGLEPFREEVFDLVRQAEQDVAGGDGAGRPARLEDPLELVVV